jgi:hypothetical protein
LFGAAAVVAVALASPSSALARPLYFQTFTNHYGLAPGNPIYACGICHQKWEGTGARNPFGTAIEQQLYVGKTILDAIIAVAGGDADGDGFTNEDEVTIHGTLPGYSCANYTVASETPANFQSLITPGVPTCLEPKDIAVAPDLAAFRTEVGKTQTVDVIVSNNGSVLPLTVTGFAVLAGSDPAYTVTGPGLPVVIPLGQSITLTVQFAPTIPGLADGTLRIQSDDPDEPDLDYVLAGVAFVRILAPAAERAACLGDVQKEAERLAKVALSTWGACYLDELGGRACDTGRRDLKIARAEARFAAVVGGEKDRRCAKINITPSRLGMPGTCGGSCDAIELHTMADVSACVICRQRAVTNDFLSASIGAAPPDVPGNRPGAPAQKCNRGLVIALQKGLKNTQNALGSCELGNITAASPVDCSSTLATTIASQESAIDARVGQCSNTTDLLACPFVPPADPACLGDAMTTIASELVGVVFAQE